MTIAFWRDLSIIWLSLFCFIALIIPIGVLYFVVRGMNFLQSKLTPLLRTAHHYSQIVRIQSENVSHKVAEPVVQANLHYTKTSTWLQSLWVDGK